MTAIVTVEDPDTFNGPLTLKQTWRKVQAAMAEMVCAENEVEHFANQNLDPLSRRPTNPISDRRAYRARARLACGSPVPRSPQGDDRWLSLATSALDLTGLGGSQVYQFLKGFLLAVA